MATSGSAVALTTPLVDMLLDAPSAFEVDLASAELAMPVNLTMT